MTVSYLVPPSGGTGGPTDGQLHNVHAEAVALGSALISTQALVEVCGTLGPEDFYRPAHSMVREAIQRLVGREEPADVVTVAAELARTPCLSDRNGPRTQADTIGPLFLHDLVEAVPSASHAGHYARIVAELAARRRALEVFDRARQAIVSLEVPVGGILERATAELSVVHPVATIRPQADSRLVAGGSFVLDAPDRPPCLWGRDGDILWADGEALMICGPTGVGKTTLVHQVVRARLGLAETAIGFPVEPTESRVLYLAMDRPPQIARAQRRLFGEEHRAVLDERLRVWKGPPPHDLAKRPETLLEMCQDAGADTVVVDSLKDACRKLSDDETGSGYHAARSIALTAGVQVVELHHQRKAGGENRKPNTIDDIYGSTWIPSGAGSVLLLWGAAGDIVVELSQIKQPAEQMNPLKLVHDHGTGETSIFSDSDPYMMAAGSPHGITAQDVAIAMFEADSPSRNQVEKARRRLDLLVDGGRLHRVPGARGGAPGEGASRYYAISCRAEEGT